MYSWKLGGSTSPLDGGCGVYLAPTRADEGGPFSYTLRITLSNPSSSSFVTFSVPSYTSSLIPSSITTSIHLVLPQETRQDIRQDTSKGYRLKEYVKDYVRITSCFFCERSDPSVSEDRMIANLTPLRRPGSPLTGYIL